MVSFDYMGDRNDAIFYSPANKDNEQMKITFNDQNSLPIVPQTEEIQVDVQFYASPKAQVPDGDTLVDKNMDVNRIQIITVGVFLCMIMISSIRRPSLYRRRKPRIVSKVLIP